MAAVSDDANARRAEAMKGNRHGVSKVNRVEIIETIAEHYDGDKNRAAWLVDILSQNFYFKRKKT